MAQLALNLAIGFAVNSLISLFSPSQKQEGPRLSDLSAPKSNYGVRIPKVWGTVRLAGNLIWANPIREKKTKQRGGKGGPKVQQTNYSYYGSFAMLLCEGPILAVTRIWLNSKLAYSINADISAKTFERSIKFRDNYLRFYLGTATQSPDPLIQASMGVEHTPAYRHRAYIVFEELPLADYGNRIPNITAEVCTVGSVDSNGRITVQKASLATIISDICLATGLSASEVDTREINQPVTGFFVNNVQAARESLSQLQQAYFFDCVESGGKLRFINQQRPGVTTTIPKAHLAAYEYGQTRPNNFQETRTQDLELPSEVDVTYLDPSFNYGEAVQYSRKSAPLNQNAQSLSLPIVLTSSEAKTIADRLLYLSWTRRRSYKFSLSLRYGLLEPGDVLELDIERTQQLQISKLNLGANLLLEIEALAYEKSIFVHQSAIEIQYCETIDNSEGDNTYQLSRRSLSRLSSVRGSGTTYTPGEDYSYDLVAGTITRLDGGSIPDGGKVIICYELDDTSPPPDSVAAGGDTTLRLLDIPLVSDRDADNGLYLAADGGDDWRFATVYVSRNGGTSYELAKNLSDRSTFGTCNTVLAAGSANGTDSINTLSVTIRPGGELESVSLTDLNNGQNTALVGNEILRFQTATLTGTNTYTLSGLQRGRRGTEWAMPDHTAGESFYLLSDYLERVEGQSQDIGRTLQFKAVTDGQSLDDVSPVAITVIGNSLKPYAPTNLAATKDAAGNINLTWTRRDRKAGDRTDYANFPLSEVWERYEIEILSGSTVVRTLTSSSPVCTLSAAQQTTDFGSIQTTISCRVYQLSGVVGRGNAAIATLTASLVYPTPTITSLSPPYGAIGDAVIITGTGFAGATAVAFNGTAASFTVDSATQITAIVPAGATSGPLTVSTPGGTATY